MSTRPTAEVAIAAGAVVAAAVAGYALGGPAAFALVAVASGAGGLVLLRFLVPPLPSAGPPGEDLSGPDPAVPQPVLSSFTGSWRRQSRLAEAQASRPAYEAGLRPQLEHLLASRLAERHGISLYDDPAAARVLFSGGQAGYDSLWAWIDPGRPPATDQAGDQPGIPYRTLARIIDRLERL
ncbi:MAG TPA: hypothetical protein VMH35_03280 [Streptosporangiaceae bacterium]|nr:hypothetical protein [Streptosporangiaceae bacterium]